MESKPKGLCIATRCATVEDFVARFHPFCDETSIFVTTTITRPVGTEAPFAILLADKTPVLRGWCIVLDAWADAANPYNRPGMRLGVHRLTVSSKTVMEQLLAMRRAAIAEGKPLVQKTQPIQIEKEPAGDASAKVKEPRNPTVIGMPALREPMRPVKRPVTVKIPAIADTARRPTRDGVAQARTITGAVPVIAMPRTESKKIAIPTLRAPTNASDAAADAMPVAPRVAAATPPAGTRVHARAPGPVSVTAFATPVRGSARSAAAGSPMPAVPAVPAVVAAPSVATAASVIDVPVAAAVAAAAPEPVLPTVLVAASMQEVEAVPPILAASGAVTDPLDGPTERMTAPPVHVFNLGVAEPAAPNTVLEPPSAMPPPPARSLAVGTSPPTSPPKLAEGTGRTLLQETRTPGSDVVLPANPLMDLTDASLEGFVDCTFYEATHDYSRDEAVSDSSGGIRTARAITSVPAVDDGHTITTPLPGTLAAVTLPAAAGVIGVPDATPATDWRIVTLIVLIAIGAAFGVSYGVASWAHARAAMAQHS